MRKLLLLLCGVLLFTQEIKAQDYYSEDFWKTATLEDVQKLINSGMDLNAKTEIGKEREKMTPLMLAAKSNKNPQVVEALIKAGADVNARNENGSTPLMYAAQSNENPQVVGFLIKAGADVNARDISGWNSLLYAVRYSNNPQVVEALIKAKADVNTRSKAGLTPLMYAARYSNNPQVVEALIKADASATAAHFDTVYGNIKKAIDYMKENEKLKGTDIYWKLNDLSY